MAAESMRCAGQVCRPASATLCALASLALWLGSGQVSRAEPSVEERLLPYVAALEPRIDPRAAAALAAIDGAGRRLLALRSYLRAGPGLDGRWSWTEQQIAAFEGSAERQALLAQIGVVRDTFERMNPSYTLFVNERVRSLDEQLLNWNTNESVAAAADNLATATLDLLNSLNRASPQRSRTVQRLAGFLAEHVPQPTPTLAAPGLSPHGQMLAIDFHVYQGDVAVAVPEFSTVVTVWDEQGWAQRLAAAVRESGARFSGPLASPREPWHYDYVRQDVSDCVMFACAPAPDAGANGPEESIVTY
jgi:hypothetical protein